MIAREKLLNELISSQDNGSPKVITGIRRCGKSYLLSKIYCDYLVNAGIKKGNIIKIDLDDDENRALRNPIKLGQHIRKMTRASSEKHYVILDEIQKVFTIVNPELTDGKIVLANDEDKEVVSFVDVVLGLSRDPNIDLYITGSNSKMLSSDIVTEFRGRATNIHVSPLSFAEYYDYVGGSQTEALYEFMQFGGMPLAVLQSEEKKKKYLSDLFEMTYLKDIIEHNHLRKSESLDELCNIISACTGSLLNAQKIADTYCSVKHEKISKQTVDKYIEYFKDAFILREARRYDLRGRGEIGASRKYYFADTGLRNARLNFAFSDIGQMLETVVHNELIYNGYTVNVGSFRTITKDKTGKSIARENEVDFYAKKGNRLYYIQVADNIDSVSTREREIKPFISLSDQIQKIIVVNRPISETRDAKGLTIIGAVDFLLKYIKD